MKFNPFIATLIFFGLFSGSHDLSCQQTTVGDWGEEYYGIEHGLPNRTVWGSCLDDNQLLWVGTDGGLCLLDGYEVIVFNDFPQLFDGYLSKDNQGNLMSTFDDWLDSLEVFNPTSFNATGFRLSSVGKGNFGGIFHESGQPLYFAIGSMIYVFDPEGNHQPLHSLSTEIHANDRLVFADENSYVLYNDKQNILTEFLGSEVIAKRLHFNPGNIFREKSGSIIISGEEGTFRKPYGEALFMEMPNLPSGKVINFFFEDNHQNCLIGYRDPYHLVVSDLHLLTEGRLESYSWLTEREDRIIGIDGDDFRNSFRLYSHGGLYIFTKDHDAMLFDRYLYQDVGPGKFGDLMRGFAADDEGNVYVNKDSRSPYWFRVDAKTLELDTLTMRNNDGTVADQYGCGTNLLNYRGDIYGHSCDVDAAKNFIGHVYRYRPADNSWKRWPLPEKNQVVRWVTNGRTADELLLVTENKFDHRTGQLYYFYPEKDLLKLIKTAGPEYDISGYTKSATFDSTRNCLWIGTEGALLKFEFESEKLWSYTFPDAGSTIVSDILIDGQDLLLGTFKRGLQNFHIPTETFSPVGGVIAPGKRPPSNDYLELPSDDIAHMGITKDSGLIITTFKGLVYYGGEHETSGIYTTEQGLTDNEFNTPSLFYADTIQKWFAGTINGFVSFSESNFRNNISPYSPALTTLRIVDETVGYETVHRLAAVPTGQIVLEPSVLYFTLNFTIPDYSGNAERRYQTFLEGFDMGWTASTITPSVRYARLEPGDYTFKLRAFDARGRESPVVREVSIRVLKPWYEQLWFYILCVFIIAASIYTFVRTRLNRYRRELESEQKLQSLELRSLRQQINPHFISNAMNAIREYVRREDAENPTKYLTDFSLMMRQFLESSRHRFTTVGKEMDMLQRYVGLEQLRFPGKFTTSFHVDPAIDSDMDEVPSLLMQPLVENAIEHGLRPLESGGELRVSIELDPFDDDVLICTVSDNGVGRLISAGSPRIPGHVSRATQILEDRRAVLERDARVKLSVTTEDLHPELAHTGTVITVRIEGS